MLDLNKLMLTREHFPIGIFPYDAPYYISGLMPPYHPSMQKNGINLELAVSVVPDALRSTANDLENTIKIMEKTMEVQPIINDINSGLAGSKYGNAYTNDESKICVTMPHSFLKTLVIEKRKISPAGGDFCIWMPVVEYPRSYTLPGNVTFSEELIKEYQMKVNTGKFTIMKCPYGWKRHNVGLLRAIFYQNLILAINNEVMKRKYENKS